MEGSNFRQRQRLASLPVTTRVDRTRAQFGIRAREPRMCMRTQLLNEIKGMAMVSSKKIKPLKQWELSFQYLSHEAGRKKDGKMQGLPRMFMKTMAI
jgi:hypothetical protein